MDERQTGRNIYFKMFEMLRQKKACVLCTVTGTQGSTPQKSGCSALFGEKGLLFGTVGGGVVELAIQQKAAGAIHSKKSGHYLFDLVNDISEKDAAICGGGMSILLDASPEEHFSLLTEIMEANQKNIPGVLLTSVKTHIDQSTSIQRMWITKEDFRKGVYGLKGVIADAVENMLETSVQSDFREFMVNKSESATKQVILLESIVPLPKLVIAGAGHVGKALFLQAKLLDFEVIVWDERKEYANKRNLPGANKIITGSIEKLSLKIVPDKNTFLVIVTPGHFKDAEVLKAFINSDAGYIGMIGSKSKIGQVKNKFLENGWATEEQWNKIYAPIGLDIHSKTVPEIAVSITAQLVKVRYELNQNG